MPAAGFIKAVTSRNVVEVLIGIHARWQTGPTLTITATVGSATCNEVDMINAFLSHKKRFTAFTFSLLFAAGAVGVALYMFSPALRATSGPTPYTVVLQETEDKAGAPIGSPHTIYTIAMRSDGSRVYQHNELPPRANPKRGRTINFSAGMEIAIDDDHSLKNTLQRPGFRWQMIALDPMTNCLTNFDGQQVGGRRQVVGRELIHGYRSVKIENVRNRDTYWYALDYGCAMVQNHSEFEGGSEDNQRLVSLVRGDPDPALFAISESYMEVLPSQVRCGLNGCAFGVNPFLSLDKIYQQQQQSVSGSR